MQHEADARVQEPGAGLADLIDLEVVAALHDELVPAQQKKISAEDDDERDQRQSAGVPEQDHRRIDHQAVGQRVGELAEARLDVPAPRQPAVDLVGDPGHAEQDRAGDRPALLGAEHEHDEKRDQRDPEQGQRVRDLGLRTSERVLGHGSKNTFSRSTRMFSGNPRALSAGSRGCLGGDLRARRGQALCAGGAVGSELRGGGGELLPGLVGAEQALGALDSGDVLAGSAEAGSSDSRSARSSCSS